MPQQPVQLPNYEMQPNFQMPFQMQNQTPLSQGVPNQQNPDFNQAQFPAKPINLQQSLIQSAPYFIPNYAPTPQFFLDQMQNFQQFNQFNPNNFQSPMNQSFLQNMFMPQPHFANGHGQQMNQQQSFSRQKIAQECIDYNQGFCINGPQCPFIHNKKSEVQRPKKVPEQYIQKVSQHFQNNGMTNQVILLEILNSVLINKLQDTQSINFSMGGTFSDVMSERSDNYARRDASVLVETTRPIIKGRTRFFIVKSFNLESIKLSIQHGVWSTTQGPTKKLTNAFKNSDHVVLIFSVNESRCIQGFALMESEPDSSIKSDIFTSDENSLIQFSDNFKVRWIIACDFPFKDLEHLPYNPMNENLPIKQSKNGQELPFKLGNYLCSLLYNSTDPKQLVLCPLEKINEEFNSQPQKLPHNYFDNQQQQQHHHSQQQYSQQQHPGNYEHSNNQGYYPRKYTNRPRPQGTQGMGQGQQHYIVKQNQQ